MSQRRVQVLGAGCKKPGASILFLRSRQTRLRMAQSLPDVVYYWDKYELRNRLKRRRRRRSGGTGDDPQQTGLMKLEWEDSAKSRMKKGRKKEKRRWRDRNLVQNSSMAALAEGQSDGLTSWTNQSIWNVFIFVISINIPLTCSREQITECSKTKISAGLAF